VVFSKGKEKTTLFAFLFTDNKGQMRSEGANDEEEGGGGFFLGDREILVRAIVVYGAERSEEGNASDDVASNSAGWSCVTPPGREILLL